MKYFLCVRYVRLVFLLLFSAVYVFPNLVLKAMKREASAMNNQQTGSASNPIIVQENQSQSLNDQSLVVIIDDEAEDSAEHKSKKIRLLPIKQFQSINQCTYEASEEDNIYGGKLMCGYFALYNGLQMLKAIGKNRELANNQCIDIMTFNRWLASADCGTLIEDNLKIHKENQTSHELGSLPDHLLWDLVEQMEIDSCVNVITLKDFNNRQARPDLLRRKIYDNVQAFRVHQIPQLVLLNTGNHWIAIVIRSADVWVMDSWCNQDQKASKNVRAIESFFRSEKIQTQKEFKKFCEKKNTRPSDPKNYRGSVNLDSDEENKKSMEKPECIAACVYVPAEGTDLPKPDISDASEKVLAEQEDVDKQSHSDDNLCIIF